MNKWMKKLTAALCAAVLMCGMAVTTYAGGGEEWDGLAPVEPLPTETVDPGEGFTEDGNLVTRDLLYDKATNKQFITVQTSGGNTFYIVIDYDKPTDEDGEQYQTYFLNMVDEADLLAAMQAAGGELPECSCADKCAVGAINTDCAICAVNMGECQGKAPEPAPVMEPEPDPKPEQPKTRKPEPPKAPVKAPEPPKAAQAPAAAPEQSVLDDNARRITEFLTGLLEHMDSPAQVQVTETEKGRYSVVLEGQKLGQLIGRRGETLDAIQQLTNYAVNSGREKRIRVHVDAENYRAKREQSLESLARKVAAKVTRYRRSVTLEPMNAYERHVIHAALQDVPGVNTYSIGSEPNRRVVVSYDRDKR